MSETNVITQSKKFHPLNEFQRGQIEALLKLNLPKTQIAKQVGISRSTLYLELKRGTTTQMNSDLTFREEYFAYTGQKTSQKFSQAAQNFTGRRFYELCRRKNFEREVVAGFGLRLCKTPQSFFENCLHKYALSLY